MRYSDQHLDCKIMQGNIGSVRDFYVPSVTRTATKKWIFSYITSDEDLKKQYTNLQALLPMKLS